MFEGFFEDTIKYLQELNENNNKQWFEANRDTYKKVLYGPFEEPGTIIPHAGNQRGGS